MERMFDRNHDGRLSAGSYRQAGAGEGHIGMRLLGFLALMTGTSAFIYFPGFALIMLALAVVLFIC